MISLSQIIEIEKSSELDGISNSTTASANE